MANYLLDTHALLWRAITDSDLLGKWFMENDFARQVGRKFTFHNDRAWNE